MLGNIIFVGGRELGARCLAFLLKKNINVVAVLCRKDEYLLSLPNSVPNIARIHNVSVFTDERDLTACIKEVDVGVCVMYPQKLSNEILSMPLRGFYNFHGAPLPEYRGCMGHIWAILNADKSYGVTAHKMTERFDAGPILNKASFDISPNETGISLHRKAVENTYKLFCDTIEIFETDSDFESRLVYQDEALAGYYNKTIPHNAEIDWAWSAEYIEKFVRALLFEGVLPPFSTVGEDKVYIDSLTVDNTRICAEPGNVVAVDNSGALIATGTGCVRIPWSGMSSELFDINKKITIGCKLGANNE